MGSYIVHPTDSREASKASLFPVVCKCHGGCMDAKVIVFGETAVDRLLQWLRASGEPKDVRELLLQYLEVLSKLVMEESE